MRRAQVHRAGSSRSPPARKGWGERRRPGFSLQKAGQPPPSVPREGIDDGSNSLRRIDSHYEAKLLASKANEHRKINFFHLVAQIFHGMRSWPANYFFSGMLSRGRRGVKEIGTFRITVVIRTKTLTAVFLSVYNCDDPHGSHGGRVLQ